MQVRLSLVGRPLVFFWFGNFSILCFSFFFRVQYCSQEIIIFREDLVNKMCRNCVRLPNDNHDVPNHVSFSHSEHTFIRLFHFITILFIYLFLLFSLQFVKTILSQGHLTPLPLYVSPVYWAYDYSLRVYPVPDVIVFADKYDPFSITSTDCLCINPVRNSQKNAGG